MTTFPVAKRKRATRAKFAKVRTGCVTCKLVSSFNALLQALGRIYINVLFFTYRKRHVKCDETKPACKNCIKWAGFCGGYEPVQPPSKSPKKSEASLTPLSPGAEATSSPEIYEFELPPCEYGWQYQAEELSPPISIDPQLSPYCGSSGFSQPAGSYFAPLQACAVFDETFWSVTLPQLVQVHAAIRYANMAVHALIFAKGTSASASGKQNGRDHYGEALSCYGLALQEARRATSQQTDLREAVICCMFFVIFETINGDRDAAHSHLQCGQKIMGELGLNCKGSEAFQREVSHVTKFLARQAREFGVGGSGCGGGFDCGNILDRLMASC